MTNAFPADAMVCFNPDGKVLWAMVGPIAALQALYGKFAATGKYESVTVPGTDNGPGLKLIEGWSCVFNGDWADKPSYCTRINAGDIIAIRYVTADRHVLTWAQRPAAAPSGAPVTVTETTTVPFMPCMPFTPAQEMQKHAEDMQRMLDDTRRLLATKNASVKGAHPTPSLHAITCSATVSPP